MSDFETPCLCFSRDARQQEPERYQWCGGVLWAIWQECPTHQERFTSPVWHRTLGQLDKTAPAYQAETVSIEAL